MHSTQDGQQDEDDRGVFVRQQFNTVLSHLQTVERPASCHVMPFEATPDLKVPNYVHIRSLE